MPLYNQTTFAAYEKRFSLPCSPAASHARTDSPLSLVMDEDPVCSWQVPPTRPLTLTSGWQQASQVSRLSLFNSSLPSAKFNSAAARKWSRDIIPQNTQYWSSKHCRLVDDFKKMRYDINCIHLCQCHMDFTINVSYIFIMIMICIPCRHLWVNMVCIVVDISHTNMAWKAGVGSDRRDQRPIWGLLTHNRPDRLLQLGGASIEWGERETLDTIWLEIIKQNDNR